MCGYACVDFPLGGSFSKAEMIVVSSLLVKESVFNKVTIRKGINSSRDCSSVSFDLGD